MTDGSRDAVHKNAMESQNAWEERRDAFEAAIMSLARGQRAGRYHNRSR